MDSLQTILRHVPRCGLCPALALFAVLVACHGSQETDPSMVGKKGGKIMTLTIKSPAFREGTAIPSQYTCEGQDISPPLSIEGVPQEARSLALICDDPDAPMGTWVHWVLFNLPPDTKTIQEHIPPDRELPNGARHGKNSWGRLGYGGPCPPSGTHRYFFKAYALDTPLDSSPGMSKRDLLKAIEGHILAEGRLMGTYKKQRR